MRLAAQLSRQCVSDLERQQRDAERDDCELDYQLGGNLHRFFLYEHDQAGRCAFMNERI